jgi:hypothetical protein
MNDVLAEQETTGRPWDETKFLTYYGKVPVVCVFSSINEDETNERYKEYLEGAPFLF